MFDAKGPIPKMTLYPIYHGLWRSFHCKEIYYQAAHYWRANSLLYLLIMVLVTTVPLAFILKSGFDDFIAEEGHYMIEQVPDFTIRNGEVIFDHPQPYPIYNLAKEPVVVFDTTGTYQHPDELKAQILVGRNTIVMKKSDHRTETIYLDDMKGAEPVETLHIDKAVVYGWVNFLQGWFLSAILPTLVIFMFFYRLLQALVYGAVGLLVALIMRAKLTYGALIRIAFLAITPSAVILALSLILGMGVSPWVYGIVNLAYLGYGIFAATGGLHDEAHKPYST